jgi:hypothetical protein
MYIDVKRFIPLEILEVSLSRASLFVPGRVCDGSPVLLPTPVVCDWNLFGLQSKEFLILGYTLFAVEPAHPVTLLLKWAECIIEPV